MGWILDPDGLFYRHTEAPFLLDVQKQALVFAKESYQYQPLPLTDLWNNPVAPVSGGSGPPEIRVGTPFTADCSPSYAAYGSIFTSISISPGQMVRFSLLPGDSLSRVYGYASAWQPVVFRFRLMRDATPVSEIDLYMNSGNLDPWGTEETELKLSPSVVTLIDPNPPPGSYAYSMQARVGEVGGMIRNCIPSLQILTKV